MKKLLSALALAACLLFSVSCNKDDAPQDPIVGEWAINGEPIITGLDPLAQTVIGEYLKTFTFTKDGKIENNPAFTGYVKKGDTLLLTFNPEISAMLALMYSIDPSLLSMLPCTVKINENEMTLAAAISIPQDQEPLNISISANYLRK